MIGERIRKLQKDRFWTQKYLSLQSGVDPKNISNYESGRLIPSGKTIAKFAKAFGVKPDDFVGDAPLAPTLAISSGLPENERRHLKWVISVAVRQNRIHAMMAS